MYENVFEYYCFYCAMYKLFTGLRIFEKNNKINRFVYTTVGQRLKIIRSKELKRLDTSPLFIKGPKQAETLKSYINFCIFYFGSPDVNQIHDLISHQQNIPMS
jgi:hypothetical protein